MGRKIAGCAPFARYVAERLKEFGVTGGKVVVAEDFDQMVQKIRKKEVDVVLESAFSAIELGNKTGMKPKLLVWKHGISEYSTLFFVRKDSPISSLKDLKGKVLALQDPYSTSGFLVPVAELRRNGIEVASSKDSAAPAVVRYVLVEHEKNQAFWVLQKRADAGAFGSDDWDELDPPVQADLRVLHTTKPVLRYLASFHPDLPAGLAAAIAKIMVGMDDDAEGRRILKEAADTRKITPLSQHDRDSLAYVRELIKSGLKQPLKKE